MVRHSGVAHRAEKDCIVVPQPVDAVFRHHAPGCLVAFTTPVEMMEVKANAERCSNRFQNAQPLRDNFLPDAIPWNDCDRVDFHNISGLCFLHTAATVDLHTHPGNELRFIASQECACLGYIDGAAEASQWNGADHLLAANFGV